MSALIHRLEFGNTKSQAFVCFQGQSLMLHQMEGNQIKIEMQSGFSRGLEFIAQMGNGVWHCTWAVRARFLQVKLLVLWFNQFHIALLCLFFSTPSLVSLDFFQIIHSLPSLSSLSALGSCLSSFHT